MNTVILAGTLIDSTGRDPMRDAAVVVEGGYIVRVASRSQVSPGPSAHVVDASDGTLMSGMFDMHCHMLYISGEMRIEHERGPEELVRLIADAMASARRWLFEGITTVRDVACESNLDLGLREAIASGKMLGPRMFCAGRALAMTGGVRLGVEKVAIQVDSPDEARKAARQQLRAGVDLIKLFASAGIGGGEGRFIGESGWPQLTTEEMQPAVFEAHKAGRISTAHAISAQAIKNAVRAGVDSVEHCTFLDEEGIALMKEREVVMVPTMAVGEHLAAQGTELGYEPHIGERAKIAAEQDRISVLAARENGIRIATGTDPMPAEANMIVSECECLHRAGLTPMEVIIAATRTGAELLKQQHRLGTVEEGKVADLIVVDGNPLDDLRGLKEVRWVLKGGQVVKSPDD
jgi:imidazolonepropionase-like amidohydrolase